MKIGICPELDPWRIVHILGSINPNFFLICVMIMAALAICQAWIRVGVCIDKCLIYSHIRYIVRLFEF